MAKNNSKFATLGLVSIVAVVGVVGLITLLQQGGSSTTTAVPVQTAQPTADVDGNAQNTAGNANCVPVWSGDTPVGWVCTQSGSPGAGMDNVGLKKFKTAPLE